MALVDVLILGGGCAGLSLAVHLGLHAPHLRVEILEQRERYTRDRTWCFWNTESHPFSDCVTHRWSRWRVSCGEVAAVQASRRYAYHYLSADRFYQRAIERIAALPSQTLNTGVVVHAVEPAEATGDRVQVHTSKGPLQARWVFDARPPRPEEISATESSQGLLQRFEGWHVRTAARCFDPATVGLMEFVPDPEAGRSTFFYTLPFSEQEALVEATFLDDPGLPPPPATVLLRERLEELTRGSGYEILFTEQGCLPMRLASPSSVRPGLGVVSLGTRGGRVKASSGYAFLRIQRQAHAIAVALGKGEPPPTRYEAPLFHWLDAVFLEALRDHPERVPSYFLQLFQDAPPDRLVRFLSETATLTEVAATAAVLPKLPFLEAAARVLLHRRLA